MRSPAEDGTHEDSYFCCKETAEYPDGLVLSVSKYRCFFIYLGKL